MMASIIPTLDKKDWSRCRNVKTNKLIIDNLIGLNAKSDVRAVW